MNRAPTSGAGGAQSAKLAERAGFEPARGLHPYTISSRARSATPAPLRGGRPARRAQPMDRRWAAWSGGMDPETGGVAERVGFEPTVGVTPYNGFRDRRLRPLSHLSAPIDCTWPRGLPQSPDARITRPGRRPHDRWKGLGLLDTPRRALIPSGARCIPRRTPERWDGRSSTNVGAPVRLTAFFVPGAGKPITNGFMDSDRDGGG